MLPEKELENLNKQNINFDEINLVYIYLILSLRKSLH